MKILAIIPARTGSKKIKNKNLKKIFGKTLIDHSAESALFCKSVMRKIISTNNPNKIKKLIKSNLFEIHFKRPKKLSTDHASSFDVVKHALLKMEFLDKVRYDLCLLLQPTCPMRSPSLIDAAVEIMKNDPLVDSVVSVVNVGATHPFRMYFLSKKNGLKPFCRKVSDPMLPRQLLPPVYIRSGDIYLTRRKTILHQNSLIGKRAIGLVVSPEKTINIDEPVDLVIAEKKMEALFKK